jgi:hypothetical protein
MKNQRFRISAQPLLINEWLIEENRQYYSFQKRTIVFESLPMMINIWMAMASKRFKRGEDDARDTKNALGLIATIDKTLPHEGEVNDIWRNIIKDDDEFYVKYYRHLIDLVKQAIASGNHQQLNGCIQNTWEYSDWMCEAGHLLVAQTLIDGWLHPLSDVLEIDGEEVVNTWMVASQICGGASGRLLEVDKRKCIQLLREIRTIDSPDPDCSLMDRLAFCKHVDAQYLILVSLVKEALDAKLEKAFEDDI